MVAYMNGHTDRYRCYVCHAGCYNWESMMATDGYAFFARELGAFYWEDSKRVARQSPHSLRRRTRRRPRWSFTASSITACRPRRGSSTTMC